MWITGKALQVIAYDFGGLTITWEDEAYRVDGTRILGAVFRLAQENECRAEGSICLEWLPEAVLPDFYLHAHSDGLLPAKELVYGTPAQGRIADVMTWTLEHRGVLWVYPRRIKWRGDGRDCYGLGDLIAAVVSNFPMLLTHTRDLSELRIAALPKDHPVTASLHGDHTLEIRTCCATTKLVHDVNSHCAVEKAIRQTAGAEVQVHGVHPHPMTSRLVSVWTKGNTGRLTRRHYKDYVRHAATKRGELQDRERAAKWRACSTKAADGLEQLGWTQLRRILGLGQWRAQLMYRLKSWAYYMYDVRNNRIGCPHAQCAYESDVDMYHVFWTCPTAKQLRGVFVGPWLRLGLPREAIEKAIFGLALSQVPEQVWTIAEQVGQSTLLRQSYRHMHHYIAPQRQGDVLTEADRVLAQAFRQPWQGTHHEVPAAIDRSEYLLFFDGGSRGNPGPGGAGAVVVRVEPEGGGFQIVWGGSMSYAATTTTNNLAENLGLPAGLTSCAQYAYSPLHVVGDSAMIIRQHACRRSPHAQHLAPIYWRCRRHLARIRVISWQHHRQDYNTMTDNLANAAMDTRRSFQNRLQAANMETRPWSRLTELVQGDVGHWTMMNMGLMSQDIEVAEP